jgi:hypothetical protein
METAPAPTPTLKVWFPFTISHNGFGLLLGPETHLHFRHMQEEDKRQAKGHSHSNIPEICHMALLLSSHWAELAVGNT